MNAETSLPRFQQIIEAIKQQIKSGRLAAHDALPSERMVAELYNVSRMTARRALAAIESEGLAYSEGRKGRYVSPKRLTYDISNMVSFAANAHAAGTDLDITLISSGTIPADQDLAEALSTPVGETLFHYTRLFRIDGHAAFLETEYVIANRFPGFLDHDLRQSSTKLLEQHYKTHADTGDITIRMRALQADEAEILGMATYQAGIELEQIIHDQSGKPFCLGRQIWRGELAEFSAQAIVKQSSDTPKQ